MSIRAILVRAMKAAKANEAQVGLALARLGTIEATLGNILRAVHIVGWRRNFVLSEVVAGKPENLFFSDLWDSPPDVRHEIGAWLESYQQQYDKLALRLREIRRIRFLLSSLPGGGVDRPDLSLLGHGRLLAGTVKLADAVPLRLGVPAFHEPVLEITDQAKRLHQIKAVLGEMDQTRIDSLRERPEKGSETEREAIRLSDGVIAGFGGLAGSLLDWLARESLAAPREIQEPEARAIPARERPGDRPGGRAAGDRRQDRHRRPARGLPDFPVASLGPGPDRLAGALVRRAGPGSRAGFPPTEDRPPQRIALRRLSA